jgi:hypothetical protein
VAVPASPKRRFVHLPLIASLRARNERAAAFAALGIVLNRLLRSARNAHLGFNALTARHARKCADHGEP